MSIIREKKEELVKKIGDAFEKYDSFYMLDFINMPVSQAVELRKQMRENSFSFMVVKNRLALRALKDDFPEDLKSHFRGPTGIAFAPENPIGLAHLIKNFSAQHKVLSVKAGMLEGRFLASEEFDKIAVLTSREDLLVKIGFLMTYSLTKLLRTWQAPLNSLGSMLSQLKTKK